MPGRNRPEEKVRGLDLEVLLSRFGKLVSKEELLGRLYGFDKEAGYNAIEAYIHRLRKKLEGAGITVRTVHGRLHAGT